MKVTIINSHFSNILGGSEIQCHQIAEGLSNHGIDVTYLAVGGLGEQRNDYDYEIHECEVNQESILSACDALNPNIVYWRYNKKFLTPVVKSFKVRDIPVVFSVSHIIDLKPFTYKSIPGLTITQRARRGLGQFLKGLEYRKGFKLLDGVICNNEYHLNEIQHSNKLYIPNTPFLDRSDFIWPRPYVIWVGNLKEHKHPELFLKLAEKCLDLGIDFLMVGHVQQQAYDYFKEPESLPPHFYFLGPQDILSTNGMIKESLLLVHTCKPEGFPNVFLQAWGLSKPVVSLYFDPGNTIQKSGAGKFSGDFESFKSDIFEIVKNKSLREDMGQKGKIFCEENYNREQNIRLLEKFLIETIRSGKE